MKQDFEVEKVETSHEGIRARIIVYRRFQPPVTLVFFKKWGGKELIFERQEIRADGAGNNAPLISKEWIEYARVFTRRIIKERLKRREKDIFWATQPRLYGSSD